MATVGEGCDEEFGDESGGEAGGGEVSDLGGRDAERCLQARDERKDDEGGARQQHHCGDDGGNESAAQPVDHGDTSSLTTTTPALNPVVQPDNNSSHACPDGQYRARATYTRLVAERAAPARKSADARRDEIVRATLGLVATKGFAGVTLREVAQEVGIVHGLIRHYFAGRDELVAAAFEHAVTAELAADDALVSGRAPVPALAAWLAATPEQHYRVWIDAWSEAPRTPALAAALERHHSECEGILTELIRRVLDERTLDGRADAAETSDAHEPRDPAAESRLLTAVADGVAVQQHAVGTLDADAANEIVFSFAEQRLGLEPGELARARPVPTRGRWTEHGGTAPVD